MCLLVITYCLFASLRLPFDIGDLYQQQLLPHKFQSGDRIGYSASLLALLASYSSEMNKYNKFPTMQSNSPSHLLDMSEPRTMSESSMREMISDVSSPLNKSSPRVLNPAKLRFWTAQSAFTCFIFKSMSFSFTALIQMS